ncbi:MAG: rhodanese-like domain-containing protein [Victivallaceae bacterium]
MKKCRFIPAFAALLLLAFAGCDPKTPTPPAGGVLLDVRSGEEFQTGALPGARNLPLDQLEARAAAELPDREAPVKLYCRSGRRSALAAETLRRLGYTRIYDLGAMENARSILKRAP